LNYRIGAAIADAFNMSPHAFLVGGISLIVAIQLVSLEILALQNKKYFEEIFHLSTASYENKQQEKTRR